MSGPAGPGRVRSGPPPSAVVAGGGARLGRAVLLALLALAVAVQLVVLYAPATPGVPLFAHADKVAHVLVFLVPTAVALLAGLRPVGVVAVFAGHAVLSELVQWAVLPTRSGDPADVVADLVGVALGVAVWRLVARPEPTRRG